MDNPTNCQNCNASLERGYSSRYQGNKLVSAICFTCARDETMAEYVESKILTTRLIEDNEMQLYRFDEPEYQYRKTFPPEELKTRLEIRAAYQRIASLIEEFESNVWFKGLQGMVKTSKVKGVSAYANDKKLNDLCVLTYSMCGRTMITIEDNNDTVSLITNEDSSEPCMGWRGICAKEVYALALIQRAIDLYQTKKLVFKEDKKVSMGI